MDTNITLQNQNQNQNTEPQGEPIGAHVNSLHTDEIVELGFTKDVAEKALFMS
jgi:hypothetical protein